MSLYLSDDCVVLKRKFSSLDSPRDVADLLEIDYKQLVYHLFKVPEPEKYTTFTIKKKSGGVREISAPVTASRIVLTCASGIFCNRLFSLASVESIMIIVTPISA